MSSSPDKKNAAKEPAREAAGLQLVHRKVKRVGPASAATGMNQHIKAAVIRLTVDSPLQIRDFSYVAKYAGTKEEKALDVLRDYIRDLRAQLPTPPRNPAMIRRAA
jgi:hypothetical protein